MQQAIFECLVKAATTLNKQGGGKAERLRVHNLVFTAISVVMQYNMETSPLFNV